MDFNAFDIFPKIDKEYRVGTPLGGLLSIVSLISTIFLFYFEFKDFIEPPVRQRLFVTSERPTGIDGITISADQQPRLYIDIDIIFPNVSCCLIHFDALEGVTQLPLPINDKSIVFTRLDPRQQKIAEYPRKYLHRQTVTEGQCGPCYKANTTECCNTCKSVYRAYRLDGIPPPIMKEIKQCDEAAKLYDTMMDNEGCRVQASYSTVKIASEFHISPGMSWYSDGWHIHNLKPFGKNFSDLNLSHTINRLKFTETNEDMPLDKFTNTQLEKNRSWRVVYTADIFNNDFSASHYEMYDPEKFSPGVVFKYDVSPISAVQYVEKENFLSLLGSFIAIVGGVLCMFRMFDTLLFARDPMNISMKDL